METLANSSVSKQWLSGERLAQTHKMCCKFQRPTEFICAYI